jgi:hypothetical protein
LSWFQPERDTDALKHSRTSKTVRCRLAGSHKVAHRLVSGVRRPNACELAGPMQLRQSERIAPVRIHPLARPFRDQSWSDHHAIV